MERIKIDFSLSRGRFWGIILPMANLFDVVSSRLFSVFNRTDRRANYELLAYIHSLYNGREVRISIGKEELVRRLTDYISKKAFPLMENADGVSITGKDVRSKALAKINQFKDAGWLEIDQAGDRQLSVSYSLNDGAGKILRTLVGIAGGEEERLGYSGYFYAVYRLLVPFDMDKAKDSFDQVVRLTGELFQALQGVISAIKRFIDRLLQNEDLTPEEILDLLLNEYEEQGVVQVFNDLKGKDNPSKYILEIVEELNRLHDEDLDELAMAYVGDGSPERLLEVKRTLRGEIEDCLTKFGSVSDLVAAIDEKNAKFYASSVRRLRFLLNTSKDLSGRIDALLKELRDKDPKADYSDVIPIYSQGYLDSDSLYSEPPDREKEIKEKSDVPDVDLASASEAALALFGVDEFSKKKIDEYVLSLLQGKEELKSTEIPLESDDDVFRFLLLQMYSSYEDVSYEVGYAPGSSMSQGYYIRNFTVKKKEAWL